LPITKETALQANVAAFSQAVGKIFDVLEAALISGPDKDASSVRAGRSLALARETHQILEALIDASFQ
jgi:hypothetical protein